ncbi:MAG: DNA adenine methylase [Candidatus Hodarchaeota archaeon]
MHKEGAAYRRNMRTNPQISLKLLEQVSNPKSIHGIYPYRGKMSPIDAAQVLSQLPNTSVLLDPFCGTGTIVYEAQARGMQAIGVDNNPLACTIALGKTAPINKEETLTRLKSAIEEARQLVAVPSMPKAASKFFHPSTAEQIMRIVEVSDRFVHFELSVLYGSICLAARACNAWKWTSTSVGKIHEPLRNVDFYQTLMRKACKHIVFVRGSPSAQIYHYDCRQVFDVVPENSVDIVYSSPPYFDALDYTGYYTKIVMDVLGMDRGAVREGLIQRYSTYRKDITKALEAINQVVKENALIIFVVGNRMVRGRLIRGSEFFAEIAPWNDPYIVERTYTNTPSGLWDRINRTKRKEQVLVWDLSSKED